MADDKIFDPSMKKKKKKKPVEEEVEAPPEEVPVVDDLEFGKKKKKKKKPLDMSQLQDSLPQEPAAEDAEVSLDFSAKKKKKKKTVTVVDDDKDEQAGDEAGDVEGDAGDEEIDYKYEELLDRAFSMMRELNPDMISGERKKMVMIPPSVARVGTKKTMFVNFHEVTKTLQRPPRHLLQFILAELGTSGSIDGNNQLLLRGRYQIKHLENVLRNYIREYVMCHTCKRTDTVLNKDTRLYFLDCKSCGSRCSVQSIKSGFQAVTGKRAALRAKTT